MNRSVAGLLAGVSLFVSLVTYAQAPSGDRAWVEESNRHAQVLLEVMAKYNPEFASSLGVEGHDSEIFDLKPQVFERSQADTEAAIAKLVAVRPSVKDARVQQDVDILIQAARDQHEQNALNQKYLLLYFNLPQAIYGGFQNLLDARVPKEKYPNALIRLKRYVGKEKGYEPITQLFRARYEERASNETLLGPWVVQVEQDLKNQERFITGIRDLLKGSKLEGWEKDFALFEKQMREYGEWVKSTVLPRARKESKLPEELYANNLKNFGVKADPRELIDAAQFAYVVTRDEMESVSRQIAKQRGWKDAGYREVISALKKEKIANDKLLEIYKGRLANMEEIVRENKIVTLRTRDAVIRLANEAESAQQPAPHIDPPRLIGNTGEPAEFVLPLSNPDAQPGVDMDDFKYDAITWTLTAHEARPGHELQFAKMLEQQVSTPRVVFAFNSANVEGWALYAEAVMKEYLPLEGQLGSLQMRLMRAARAFLDPMVNLGLIQPDGVKKFLIQEVMLSEPMAKQEVDRYTFRAPGQATAYFYGYSKLEALRAKTEIALGDAFDEGSYHDFIVNQGLLPLELLDKAVMEQYVPSRKKGETTAANP
jgi:uncharacterized protein (DUF885 family)